MIALTAVAALAAFPGEAGAGPGIFLEADEVVADPAALSVEAVGNVTLVAGPLSILARKAVVDLAAGSLLLEGAALVLDLPARRIVVDAAVASLSDGALRLEHGSGTLCGCGHSSLALSFGSLQVDADGDLVVRRGWIVLGGLRVLPVPWLLLRTGRKPGLTLPGIGYGPRGLAISMGAAFPMPGTWDLDIRIGWIAPDGLVLTGILGPPGSCIRADVFLDPVPGGMDSGWITGSIEAGGRGWRAGLVLDQPLASSVHAWDVPPGGSHAGRIGVDALTLLLRMPVTPLFVLGEVSAFETIGASPSGGGVDLVAREAWARLPSVSLVLLPVRVFGARAPVTLAARIDHLELLPLSAPPGSGLLQSSGVGLDLAASFRPLGVVDVDLRAGWNGSVDVRADGLEPPVWMHGIDVGLGAAIRIAGPPAASGPRHVVDMSLRYLFAAWDSTRWWTDLAAPFLLARQSGHVAGISIVNSVVAGAAAVFGLETAAWLVSRVRGDPGAILSATLDIELEAIGLHVEVDVPSSTWLPSLIRTGLRASMGGVELVLEHLYLDGSRETRLDLEARISPLVRSWAAGAGIHGFNLGILGMGVPVGAGLLLTWSAGVDFDAGRPSFLGAALAWVHPCGCISARLEVRQRAGVPAPEVLLTLGL